jgi:hypothetical protein
MQRRIAEHKAELAVHRDHLENICNDVDRIVRRVTRAIERLDEATGELGDG